MHIKDFQARYQYNTKTDILGKGGFAIVYKANDTLLGRVVALKFFSNSSNDGKHTLIKEISRVISLEHPNLCRYYDASVLESQNLHGETDETEVGVMEFLDGGDLRSYCKAHGEHQLKLLTDVLRGMAFLHKKGIIHRDLKPQNILIKNQDNGPVAKITDFGISKDIGSGDTSSSLLMGTIEYMAPEQFNPGKYGINGKIGTNLDLWSYGLIVYELITGDNLFGSRGQNESAEQVMGNILNDELVEQKIAHLPQPYFDVVKRCLIKDAKQRVQNPEDLIDIFTGNSTSVFRPQDLPKQETQETMVIRSDPKGTNEAKETMVIRPGSIPGGGGGAGSRETMAPRNFSDNGRGAAPKKKNKMPLILGVVGGLAIAGLCVFLATSHSARAGTDKTADSTAASPKAGDSAGLANGRKGTPGGSSPTSPNGTNRLAGANPSAGPGKNGQLLPGGGNGGTPGGGGNGAAGGGGNGAAGGGGNAASGSVAGGKLPVGGGTTPAGGGSPSGGAVSFEKDGGYFEGMASATNGVKHGYVDASNKLVVPLIYDDVGPFSQGLAWVSKDDKVGYIDKTGKTVITFIYTEGRPFAFGVAIVRRDGKWGVIDLSGREIVSAIYDDFAPFSEGLAKVKKDGKFGYLNTSGTMVLPLVYDYATQFNNGKATVKKDGQVSTIDKNGNVVRDLK